MLGLAGTARRQQPQRKIPIREALRRSWWAVSWLAHVRWGAQQRLPRPPPWGVASPVASAAPEPEAEADSNQPEAWARRLDNETLFDDAWARLDSYRRRASAAPAGPEQDRMLERLVTSLADAYVNGVRHSSAERRTKLMQALVELRDARAAPAFRAAVAAEHTNQLEARGVRRARRGTGGADSRRRALR
jgi:hypothetical protein